MKGKILNVKRPMITSYTHHAHLLAILETQEDTLEWIFSNYIQIYINTDLSRNSWGDFYFPMPYEIKEAELCKWIYTQKQKDRVVDKRYEDIIEFLIDAIEDDSYIHLMVNYKYISKSRCFGIDRSHDIMVYGYDEEKQKLYCADFFFQTGSYEFSECTYDEFRLAYKYAYHSGASLYLKHYIYTYQLNKSCDYEFNSGNILYGIEQYMRGGLPEYWAIYNRSDLANISFGLDCYDVLYYYVENLGEGSLDIRLFYLMKDHKKMMIERLKFLEKKDISRNMKEYIEKYEDIYRLMNTVVMLVLKFGQSGRGGVLGRIGDGLLKSKELEHETICRLMISLREGNKGCQPDIRN